MAQKRNIVIKTPRGSIYTVKTANGSVTAKMEWNHGFSGQKSASFGEAQEFVDSECIRRMNPEGTVIGSGEINQITPYARRQYYEHKEKSRWFERMKNRHRDSILKGAQKYAGG